MKTKLIILLFAAFGMKAQLTDDQKHYVAGVVITNFVGSSAYFFDIKPFPSCAIGLGAGVLAGAGKEYIWDRAMGKGTFSKFDLLTTCLGSGVGFISLRIGINENQKKYGNITSSTKFTELN